MDKLRMLIADKETEKTGFEYYFKAMHDLGVEDIVQSIDTEKAEGVDGIILPGSYSDINPAIWGEKVSGAVKIDDELDEGQRKILDLAIEKGIPVIGMCRGIQFINVYFGGTIIQDLHCAEAHKTCDPDRYHQIYTTPGSFMETLYGESVMVNSRHHQAVGKIGKGLQIAARWICDDTTGRAEEENWEKETVDVLVHETYQIIGLQWHPEKMMYLGNPTQQADGRKMLEYYLDQVRSYHAKK
ncbi:MAG: gamma-glutamyl-gamma-aminobutyrate hydrolase family protein [Firmicutes bacterium]|nr:gamma-glutamyl-gamma-aminobutyrate hydrolase family protein [Bacillota bacterium]